MKYLNTNYKLFESEINEIIEKCKEYNINNYEIGDDGLVTVFSNVNLSEMGLKVIPLKFKEVHGYFDISKNDITSLYGSPFVVKYSFFVSYTNIKNFKYAPVEIGGGLYCNDNNSLINIIHFPKHVDGDVSLWRCRNLKSLYGCLKFLNGGIDINGCCGLNTLNYGPNKVLGYYTCRRCKLKTLYGSPEYVGGDFDCSINNLTSLKYSPNYIGGNFYFYENNIRSFYYFPNYVGEKVFCYDNPVNNVWKLFDDEEYINYFNQLKIISYSGKKINIKRLNVFLNSIGKDSVKSVDGYENI